MIYFNELLLFLTPMLIVRKSGQMRVQIIGGREGGGSIKRKCL